MTLELVRNFGKRGWEVFAADSIKPCLTQYSNHLKKFFTVSSPRFCEKTFIEELIQIVNENRIDILFPTCEEIFWIAKNKNKLLENCHVQLVCDDIENLTLLHDKYRFIEFARSQNLSVPETHIFRTGENLNQKVVIKPVFSRFGEDVIIAADNHTLINKTNFSDKQYIIQEFINGENFCSYGFADNGVLKFNICYQSPFAARTCTAFQPFQCKMVNDIVYTIVSKLNFTGNISFDFIKKDEKYFLIECNPRITSGIHTLFDTPFDRLFFGTHREPTYKNAQLFFPTVASSFKFPPYTDVVWDFKDIKPFFKQLRCLSAFYSIARKHKITLTKAMTFDIEWNG